MTTNREPEKQNPDLLSGFCGGGASLSDIAFGDVMARVGNWPYPAFMVFSALCKIDAAMIAGGICWLAEHVFVRVFKASDDTWHVHWIDARGDRHGIEAATLEDAVDAAVRAVRDTEEREAKAAGNKRKGAAHGGS